MVAESFMRFVTSLNMDKKVRKYPRVRNYEVTQVVVRSAVSKQLTMRLADYDKL